MQRFLCDRTHIVYRLSSKMDFFFTVTWTELLSEAKSEER